MISRRRLLAVGAAAVVGAVFYGVYKLAPDGEYAPAKTTSTVTNTPTNLPLPQAVRAVDIREIMAVDHGYMAGGVVNPVLLVRRGEDVNVELVNSLGEETIIHWHGFRVDWRNDAHPSFAVKPGGRYKYSFTVRNRPGTYIYHPHPHGLTAAQFYRGLAGLVIVEEEKRLGFRYGVNDIPLVLSDKRVRGGRVVYDPTHMDMLMGFLGDVVTVNGAAHPTFRLPQGTYRFRLVNASNARLYNLALVGREVVRMRLIAVDQGQLEKPVEVKSLFIAPAERAEVVVDLRPGVYELKNLPFDPMHLEMGGHSMPSAGLEEGAEYTIARIIVGEEKGEHLEVPPHLPDPPPPPPERFGKKRTFRLSLQGMQWVINGMFWDNPLRPHVEVNGGEAEVWEIVNDAASMPHPMHLHGFPMWVLERRNSPPQVAAQAVDSRGRLPTDLGLKDTVLVWPGEAVVVAVEFDKFNEPQLFPFHCHNLEHEDGGMMINIRINI
ncbi:MAG: multicopper oxidase family protein [Pyrobaculum sp.]